MKTPASSTGIDWVGKPPSGLEIKASRKPAGQNRPLSSTLLRGAANGCLLLLVSGCFPSKLLEAPGRPVPPPASSHFMKLAGSGLNLGESQAARIKPDEFLAKTEELLQQDRQRSARIWVERYPDVALDVLRSGAIAGSPAWQFIAGVYDAQCTRGEAGWLALLKDRVANPARYDAYDKARAQFWTRAQAHQVDEALALKLPELARHQPLLQIDAWHLHGNALLTANKPAEADAAYARALKLCGDAHPQAAAQLLLVQSEALRRAEKFEQAKAAWLQAVERGGQLLAGQQPLADPIFWERAAYLRPLPVSWPTEVANRLGRLGQVETRAAGQPDDEALVWCGIGKLRLERGESQAALVAAKRGESLTLDANLRAWLQLGQAQALLQLNQQPSAVAILAPLTSQAQPPLAAGALALVGAARYHGGSPTQAVGFLKRALELGGDWPGRADAEADLALVYLTLGQEQQGLDLLHAAQQRFESAGRFLSLRQSLLNEQEYWTRKNKPEEAGRISVRLEAMEAGS